MPGVVVVVLCPVLVCLTDFLARLLLIQSLPCHDTAKPVGERRLEENTQTGRIVPEYVVGAAAGDDAVPLADQLPCGS